MCSFQLHVLLAEWLHAWVLGRLHTCHRHRHRQVGGWVCSVAAAVRTCGALQAAGLQPPCLAPAPVRQPPPHPCLLPPCSTPHRFVAAMVMPGAGRNDIPNRLKRQFAIFHVPPPSEAAINDIFGSLMAGRFNPGTFSPKVGRGWTVQNLMQGLQQPAYAPGVRWHGVTPHDCSSDAPSSCTGAPAACRWRTWRRGWCPPP